MYNRAKNRQKKQTCVIVCRLGVAHIIVRKSVPRDRFANHNRFCDRTGACSSLWPKDVPAIFFVGSDQTDQSSGQGTNNSNDYSPHPSDYPVFPSPNQPEEITVCSSAVLTSI